MAYAIIADRDRYNGPKHGQNVQKRLNKRADKFRKNLKKDSVRFTEIFVPAGTTDLPASLARKVPAERMGSYYSEQALNVFMWPDLVLE